MYQQVKMSPNYLLQHMITMEQKR